MTQKMRIIFGWTSLIISLLYLTFMILSEFNVFQMDAPIYQSEYSLYIKILMFLMGSLFILSLQAITLRRGHNA
jgi:hypothetical protein